jgi:hypothetical protein
MSSYRTARARTTPPVGIVLFRGPSKIDGSPIVVIATGLRRPSQNAKTGAMVQVWILREDVDPVSAIHSGADHSICGDCPLRGIVVDGRNRRRACYVVVDQAPLAVWRAFRNSGLYEPYEPQRHDRFLRGRKIRFGAFGDPVAAPYSLWSTLARLASAHTGYSRSWRTGRFWRFRALLMASVESERDAQEAQRRGWRTFRIRRADDPLMDNEIACPASAERGHKTTCERCGLCRGTYAAHQQPTRPWAAPCNDRYVSGPDVAIVGHGGKPKLYSLERYVGGDQ